MSETHIDRSPEDVRRRVQEAIRVLRLFPAHPKCASAADELEVLVDEIERLGPDPCECKTATSPFPIPHATDCPRFDSSLEAFVRGHREMIDSHVRNAVPNLDMSEFDDDDRESWVLNDEGLYNTARELGVDFEEN